MKNFRTINYEVNNQIVTVYIDDSNNTYLTQKDIANLFNKNQSAISKQIEKLSIKSDYGLIPKRNIQTFKTQITSSNGRRVTINLYPLELVIQIGYRFCSSEALRLKEYLDNLNDDNEQNMDKVIIYNNNDISINVKVSPKEDTVWVDLNSIAKIMNRDKSVISKHIKDIFLEGELEESSTVAKNATMVPKLGRAYITNLYNLDVVISVGFRVKSPQAITFRKWAISTLKQFLLKGYVLNPNRITLSKENYEHLYHEVSDMIIDMNGIRHDVKEIRTDVENLKDNLGIKSEKIIEEGAFFDSYVYLLKILKTAKKEIIIIDPYFDDKGLEVLSKIDTNIKKIVYSSQYSKLSSNEIELYKRQYGEIEFINNESFHDRYIHIDKKDTYLLGTSINYLGNKIASIVKISDEDNRQFLLKKLS